MLRRVVGEPRLTRLLQVALRAVYGRYVPEPVKNSLRLQLMLLRRDVEPARATPPTGRIVVLAPHMDDEVFGCGGTIALAADAGARVTFVYVTDGSKGYPAARLQGPVTREAADSEATLVAWRIRNVPSRVLLAARGSPGMKVLATRRPCGVSCSTSRPDPPRRPSPNSRVPTTRPRRLSRSRMR